MQSIPNQCARWNFSVSAEFKQEKLLRYILYIYFLYSLTKGGEGEKFQVEEDKTALKTQMC